MSARWVDQGLLCQPGAAFGVAARKDKRPSKFFFQSARARQGRVWMEGIQTEQGLVTDPVLMAERGSVLL